MTSTNPIRPAEGITLGQAALIAGLGLLVMTVTAPFAEFFVRPKLIVPGDIEQTIQNLVANRPLFVAGILAYLVTFICDVIVAWALYVLLIPVNRAVSLLSAWFRLIYTAIALFSLLNLVTLFHLLDSPSDLAVFRGEELHAHVRQLVDSFRSDWAMGLVLFGIHLVLLGYLVYRSTYIPRIIGVLLAIDGFCWVIDSLKPYLYSRADLRFLVIVFLAELIFMVWLLVRGRKIQDRVAHSL